MNWKEYLRYWPLAGLLLLAVSACFLIFGTRTESIGEFLVSRSALSSGPCPITSSPLSPQAEHWRERFGVDLVSAKGTRVSAASDGVVIYLGKCGSYGNVVILAHGDDAFTMYAHLGEALHGLHHHAFVHQGQDIGEVVPPDGIEASHLHFEVWEEKGAAQSRSETSRAPLPAHASLAQGGGN